MYYPFGSWPNDSLTVEVLSRIPSRSNSGMSAWDRWTIPRLYLLRESSSVGRGQVGCRKYPVSLSLPGD